MTGRKVKLSKSKKPATPGFALDRAAEVVEINEMNRALGHTYRS